MDKEWDQRACWRQWVAEEQTSLYSLAFFLTGDRSAATALTGQAVASAYRSYRVFSKALFLETVAGNICRLSENRLCLRDFSNKETDFILKCMHQLEGELRLVVLYHCLLKFDRSALAMKLEWPREKLDAKLNQALAKLQESFLAQGLIDLN